MPTIIEMLAECATDIAAEFEEDSLYASPIGEEQDFIKRLCRVVDDVGEDAVTTEERRRLRAAFDVMNAPADHVERARRAEALQQARIAMDLTVRTSHGDHAEHIVPTPGCQACAVPITVSDVKQLIVDRLAAAGVGPGEIPDLCVDVDPKDPSVVHLTYSVPVYHMTILIKDPATASQAFENLRRDGYDPVVVDDGEPPSRIVDRNA